MMSQITLHKVDFILGQTKDNITCVVDRIRKAREFESKEEMDKFLSDYRAEKFPGERIIVCGHSSKKVNM